jgi:hypothetical protein
MVDYPVGQLVDMNQQLNLLFEPLAEWTAILADYKCSLTLLLLMVLNFRRLRLPL